MEEEEEEEEKGGVEKSTMFIIQEQNRRSYDLNISRLLSLLLVKVEWWQAQISCEYFFTFNPPQNHPTSIMKPVHQCSFGN